MVGLLFAGLVVVGFIVALLSWGWIMQSLVTETVSHWNSMSVWKRILFFAIVLIGISIGLRSLSIVDKHFCILVDHYLS